MEAILSAHRNRHALERLKCLYSDLLQCIDIAKEDLGRRGEIERDDSKSDTESERTQEGSTGSCSSIGSNAGEDVSAVTTERRINSSSHNKDHPLLVSLQRLRRSFVQLSLLNHHHQRQQKNKRSRLRRRRNPVKFRAQRVNPEDLQTAFLFLAATRSSRSSHNAAAYDDEPEIVAALNAAKYMERTVAKIIRQIGEIVVHGGINNATTIAEVSSATTTISMACDPCFEYFCEKNILHLLVDIAREKDHRVMNDGNNNKSDDDDHDHEQEEKNENIETANENKKLHAAYHGVVWSASVKAQVLQTVSLLVSSGARKQHFLYYLLSQNSINELLSCMLPLTQWTHPALEKIMPAFVDLIKNLGLQLAGSPELFPFFVHQSSFPLLHAALDVGTSAYAQSDSFAHITCLSMIVNTMKIDTAPVRAWVSTAVPEMQHLCEHLSQLLLDRYHRMVDISTGPIVDGLRCNAVGAQLVALQDQINVLNDIFSCEIPGLNVRLCEELIRSCVLPVLSNLEPPKERSFLHVGVSDLDVIPHRECLAQGSMVFFAQLFQFVDYVPFVRMLGVALFHPHSCAPLLTNEDVNSKPKTAASEYIYVPTLDAIAQEKGLKCGEIVGNPYRAAFLKTMRGEFGDWRFPPAAIVLEAILSSDDFDLDTLQVLNIIPGRTASCPTKGKPSNVGTQKVADKKICHHEATEFELTLADYLQHRSSARLTPVLRTSLECAGSLVLTFYHKTTLAADKDCANYASPVIAALRRAHSSFCERTMQSQKNMGDSDIFLELVEGAVLDRYIRVAPSSTTAPPSSIYACHLSQIGCPPLASSPTLMVRRMRCERFSEVEQARLFVEMAIHFRALCTVVDKFSEMRAGASKKEGDLENVAMQRSDERRTSVSVSSTLDLLDVADDFAISFGDLERKPGVGTDLNFDGRMTFPCFLSAGVPANASFLDLAEDVILRNAASLVLVIDPTDLFVTKLIFKGRTDRGTIVCRVPLQSVIAAASDDDRLHIAVRHTDVGRLIKNGNMVLGFENAKTSVIVQEFLNRSRNSTRQGLNERFKLFMQSGATDADERTKVEADEGEQVLHDVVRIPNVVDKDIDKDGATGEEGAPC